MNKWKQNYQQIKSTIHEYVSLKSHINIEPKYIRHKVNITSMCLNLKIKSKY